MNEFLESILERCRPLFRFIMKLVPLFAILLLATIFGLIIWASTKATPQVLETQGTIATAERDTLYLVTLIMLIVVIPVFVLAFFIAFRYRESNKKAKYMPEWADNKKLEFIWWGIPIAIITVLSVLAYQTSHKLDPYRPLDSSKPPVQVQVVALQWKWLFIYPESNVASVDEFAMPVNTPVEFSITSDAPMNSFWIPQLGGQIYAMTGMSTKLHLSADKQGDYRGVSANISGEGHAQMTFTAKAMSDAGYQAWLKQAGTSQNTLDARTYEDLRLPSLNNKVSHYRLGDNTLYDQVIARYSGGHTMEGISR
jgi:cytochrome o ubiquinol oxidase subunit 2